MWFVLFSSLERKNCLTDEEKRIFIKRLVETILREYPGLSCDQIMNRLGYCRKLLKKCCSKTDVSDDKKRKGKLRNSRNEDSDCCLKKFSYAKTLIERVMKENPHFDIKKVKHTVNELLNVVSKVSGSDNTDSDKCSSESSLDVELGSLDCTAHDTAFDVIMEGVLGKRDVCVTSEPKIIKCQHNLSREPRLKLPQPPACAQPCDSCEYQTPFMPWEDTDFAKLQSKLKSPRGGRCDPEMTNKVNSYLDDVCQNLLGGSALAKSVPKKSFSQRNPCRTNSESRLYKSKSISGGKVNKTELRKCLEEMCFKAQKAQFKKRRKDLPNQTNQKPMMFTCSDTPSNNFQSASKGKSVEYVCHEAPFEDSWDDDRGLADYRFSGPPKFFPTQGYYEPEETYFPQAYYNQPYLQRGSMNSYNPEPTTSYDPCFSPLSPRTGHRTYDPIRRDGMYKCDPSNYQNNSRYKHRVRSVPKEGSFANRNPCSISRCLPLDAEFDINKRPNTVTNMSRPIRDRYLMSDYSYPSPQYAFPQYGFNEIDPYC